MAYRIHCFSRDGVVYSYPSWYSHYCDFDKDYQGKLEFFVKKTARGSAKAESLCYKIY